MRAIADDAAKQAVGELAEDQAPVMASVQADLIELKHRVLTQVCARAGCARVLTHVRSMRRNQLTSCTDPRRHQNEATVSAIQSTDRKATATVEALQHKVGMLLQDMEGRLTEADKEVAQRVMAAEANAQNLSRSVGEMVPTDQVSQVEAQAKANAAKTKVRACVCGALAGRGVASEGVPTLTRALGVRDLATAGAGAEIGRTHSQHTGGATQQRRSMAADARACGCLRHRCLAAASGGAASTEANTLTAPHARTGDGCNRRGRRGRAGRPGWRWWWRDSWRGARWP